MIKTVTHKKFKGTLCQAYKSGLNQFGVVGSGKSILCCTLYVPWTQNSWIQNYTAEVFDR